MPTDNNQQSQNKDQTSLELLRVQLRAVEKLIGRSPLPRGDVNLRIGMIRFQIRKIYGDDHTILELFPKLPEQALPDVVRDHLSLIISRLNALLTLFESAGHRLTFRHGSNRVFIGHGNSPLWREVKDFLSDRLHLSCDEFNREAVAGLTTVERWSNMLDDASFAFLIMTAEDEHADSTMHARENVIHEVGLFQGRLGPKRAIILLEEGCKEFSNINGLSQIRFAPGRISGVSEEIRRVLERESIIEA